uniref:MarR family transcriptional regulator n=1 Tax=Streptomyces sp. NBC_00003 TaxID=2903608 RepID=A0AAU2VIP3_9ACTN
MANPGYGKRCVPGQLARTNNDFAHLPPREAAVAAYVDRLPEGADISVKTLAKVLPYGQCALRTALQRLVGAGHLRRGREHLLGSDSARWVTRTWFSRTARDDGWWAEFTRGCVDDAQPSPPPSPSAAPASAQHPTRSRAFILLAALGRTAPVLSLSARDCSDLEPLVAEWFERGATEQDVLRALTTGLPAQVYSAAALTRTRLIAKLPPEPASTRPALRVLECAKCGTPGRPEALPGGECAPCRGEPTPRPPAAPLPSEKVRTRAAEARAAASRCLKRAPA